MIIVEGHDNTGKTTLIDYLVREFRPVLNKAKSIGPGPELGKWTINQLKKREVGAIYDRFFFSELVYGPILRGRVCFNDLERYNIVELIKRPPQPFIIWCRRPLKRIAESFHERDQLEGVRESLPEIQEAYLAVMTEFINTVQPHYLWVYDYEESDSLKNLRPQVASYLFFQEGLTWDSLKERIKT